MALILIKFSKDVSSYRMKSKNHSIRSFSSSYFEDFITGKLNLDIKIDVYLESMRQNVPKALFFNKSKLLIY
jgi:hypothetical protein